MRRRSPFGKPDDGSWRTTLAWLLALALLAALPSCGIGLRTRALLGGKIDFKVLVSDTANQNSPVALDFLLVYNSDLLKELAKMPARDWFDKRDQIKRDYADDTGLEVWQWEWVPGQNVPLQRLPLKPKAKGGVIFANYLSPGEHRARIDPHESLMITLLEKSFTVRPLP